MNHATNYDAFSCFLDLLAYQKTEITDSVSNMLDTSLPLLEEGLLLCTFPLPSNNNDFKMYIRKITHDPLVLEKFILEIENDTTAVIRCYITYDSNSFKSEPLFKFPSKDFKNLSNLQKQLNALTFSFKVLKSHLFFQVMLLNGAGTKFEFHYNATRDSYATSPNGWSYSMFLQQYGNKITSVKALSAVQSSATVPRPASSQSQCVQPPSPVPNLSSIPPEAAASSVYLTPHRTRSAPDRRDTSRRHIFEDPNARSRHSSDTVKEDIYTTRLCRNNFRIIQEIAEQEKFSIDTNNIQEMLNSKSAAKWSIYRYGTLDLAIRGVIPIIDKRVVLEEILVGDVQANTTSEGNNEKEPTDEIT